LFLFYEAGSPYVVQAGLDPPASASPVLGLQSCTTTHLHHRKLSQNLWQFPSLAQFECTKSATPQEDLGPALRQHCYLQPKVGAPPLQLIFLAFLHHPSPPHSGCPVLCLQVQEVLSRPGIGLYIFTNIRPGRCQLGEGHSTKGAKGESRGCFAYVVPIIVIKMPFHR
jgi:hypothetical protein